jgi:hypothetical protein
MIDFRCSAFNNYVCRFFPEATEAEARDFAQARCAETMAEFQGLLLALEQEWETLGPISTALDRVGTSR